MTLRATLSGGQPVRHGGSQVPVRVPGAGVTATGITTRTGWYGGDGAAGRARVPGFPRIPGSELCGRVVARGAGVDGLAVGARVICPASQSAPTAQNPLHLVSIGSEHDGALARYCLVPVRHPHDVTASALSDVEIGAKPCACGAVADLAARAVAGAGEWVPVTAVSGGFGLAAVRLALLRDARVTGQARPEKAGVLRAAGAAVPDRDATPGPRGFDLVIDVVGGAGWQRRPEARRPGGRGALTGAVAGPIVQGGRRAVCPNDLAVFWATHQPRTVFAGLVTLINTARIRPVVAQTCALRDIAQARADLAAGRMAGKPVLQPRGAGA